MKVWCIDSPGYGGSELDLLNILHFVDEKDCFFISKNIDQRLNKRLAKTGCKIIFKKAGNSPSFIFSNLLFFLKEVSKRRKATYIIWAHHFDSNRWLAFLLALSNRKFIIVERALVSDLSFAKRSRLVIPLKKFLSQKAHAIVLCAHSHKSNYQQWFNPKHLLIIPNSRECKSAYFDVDVKSSMSKNHFNVTSIGRLDENKNHVLILKALKLLNLNSKVKVVIAGEGEKRSSLQFEAEKNNLELELLGYVDDVFSVLSAADVFVFPSLAEGLPGSLIEAMSFGVPCIASNILGNNELVIHEKTGLLFDSNDPKELAKAIERLFNDPIFSKQLARNAYCHISANYSKASELNLWQQLLN